MEEAEVPTEHLHEEINHRAEHAGKSHWTMGVALSSALLAGLAAVSSLLAGHHANEAMIEQIQSSDKWAYYQAKGIKAAVLGSKIELLDAEGKAISGTDKKKMEAYKEEQDQISSEATEKEQSSENHLKKHVVFARCCDPFPDSDRHRSHLGADQPPAVLAREPCLWPAGCGLPDSGVLDRLTPNRFRRSGFAALISYRSWVPRPISSAFVQNPS